MTDKPKIWEQKFKGKVTAIPIIDVAGTTIQQGIVTNIRCILDRKLSEVFPLFDRSKTTRTYLVIEEIE